MAGLWEFPGGKLEAGETPEECLARELHEELGMVVTVGTLLHRQRHTSERGPIELLFFEARTSDTPSRLTDHDKVCWVRPADLPKYNWVPADADFARRLAGQTEEERRS